MGQTVRYKVNLWLQSQFDFDRIRRRSTPVQRSTCCVDNYYAALLRRRGRILRRTLSVCLSVCLSVRLSVRPSHSRK